MADRSVNTRLSINVAEYLRNLKAAAKATEDFAQTVERSAARATAAITRMNQQQNQSTQSSSRTRLTQAQRDQQAMDRLHDQALREDAARTRAANQARRVDQQNMNRLHDQALREDAARTRAAAQNRANSDRQMARLHEQALREDAARTRAAHQARQNIDRAHGEALRENAKRQAAADKAAADAARRRADSMEQVSQAAMVGGALLVAGWGMAVNAAMKFEKQMSAVQAAAGATGKSLDALRQSALDAGAATAFSATEAAQGQEELAKAGIAVKDILGGGLKGALDLAAAGQLSVAESAEVAATAMTQFRLKGHQVPHIADLLSAAANKAQGDVHQMGQALKMGGLVASQFGWSIEETVGTLAMFAKAGLLGSDAGTSMKQMLLMLANPTAKASTLMENLGIAVYDANGHFLSAQSLAGQLQSQLGHLGEAERNAALATIFGADAIRGASIAYQNGAEGAKTWENNVNDAGNAARTAETKMDNLAGDLEKLKGAMETALIESGSSSTGVLRLLTQAAGNTVDGFIGLPPLVQTVGTAMAATTGIALLAAGAYGVMAPKIVAASAALVGLGAAGRVANTALVATAKYGGLLFASMAVSQIAFASVGKSASLAGQQLNGFSRSLVDWGTSGKAGNEATHAFREGLKHLDYDLGTLNQGNWANIEKGIATTIEGLTGLGGAFDESVEHAGERIANLDKALADLANNGHAEQAAAAFSRLRDMAREKGISLEELRKGMPNYTAALEDAASATDDAAGGMGKGGQKAREMASGMSAAIKEAGSLADALKALNDVNMGAFEAQNAYQLGLNGLSKALRENKSAWHGSSDAAINNRQAIAEQIKAAQAYLGAQYEVTAATKSEAEANAWVTSTHKTLRGQIINSAVAAGINKNAVAALVDQLFRVPANTPARVSTPGAAEAKARVEDFRRKAQEINRTFVATIRVNGTSAAAASINMAKAAAERLERTYTATIVTNKVTREQYFKDPRIQGPYAGERRWGGIDHHMAAGGTIQAHFANAPTVLYGERATGGEAFIPRIGDPARSRAILAEAASWYGGQVAFSGGASMVGAARAAGAGGNVTNIYLSPSFSGPVGSRLELENWLTRTVDTLKRQGRV